jgi:CopG family nickel-responsive transcriptional regulator
VVGAVTLIYDHHWRQLPDKLMELQHEYHEVIISTVHSHLDHDMCLEVVVVRGKLKQVQELGSRLIGLKGVQHGKLVMSSVEAYERRSVPSMFPKLRLTRETLRPAHPFPKRQG